MGRPSGFDREAAIETAMQEIWRNGYEASSVKAMSEKLGITRSSYYNSFRSREELFKETMGAYCAQSPDRVLHDELPDMPILVLLTRVFREICAARASDSEARGCLIINCLTEFGGMHEDLRALPVEGVLNSAVRLEELLTIAIKNGELPKETDVHGKALALQTLMIGINAFSKALRDEAELWLTVKTTLEALGIYREG